MEKYKLKKGQTIRLIQPKKTFHELPQHKILCSIKDVLDCPFCKARLKPRQLK